MDPLNRKERGKAFRNFIILFVICIGIISTTVFFSLQVPFKQNDRLITEMRSTVKEKEFAADFMTDVSGVAGMLDSINTKAQKPDLLDGQITERIKALNLKVDANKKEDGTAYRNVVFVLSDLQTAKKQLRDMTGKDMDADGLKKELQTVQGTLDGMKVENLNLKQQVFILQQQLQQQPR